MATLEKIYRLSIQGDAAQQTVDALTKKLAKLDSQLDGISKDSDIGRGIVAEMGKVVAELEAAEKSASSFNQQLDALNPNSIRGLEQEIAQLQEQVRSADLGTAGLAEQVQLLAAKESQLRAFNNSLLALNPRAQGRAFSVFSQAVVAGLTGCTIAAEAFGLSEENVAKAQAKIQAGIGILLSIEQLTKAASGENIALGKSMLTAAKGWLGFGDAAKAGSATARTAIASTGIGLLVLAVGALIALFMDWGSQVKGSESTFTKYKATVVGVFDGLLAAIKNYYTFLLQLVTFDWSGAAETAKKAGGDIGKAFADGRSGVIDEARRAEIAHEAEHTARLLDILKARGVDTLALEVENSKRVLESKKKGDKDYEDAARDFVALKAQLEKRAADEADAARLSHLNGLAAAESARGADVFRQQLAAKREQLAQQRQAELDGEHVTQAQKLQLQSEYDDLVIAHDKLLDEKRRALRLARLNGELAVLEAGGREQLTFIGTQAEDENKLALLANTQKLVIAAQAGRDLRAQAQVDWAAVKQNETEQYTLGIERARLYTQQQVQVAVQGAQLRGKVEAALLASADRRENALKIDPQAVALAKRSAERLSQEQLDVIADNMARAAKSDTWGNLLIKLFGVSDAQAQQLKQVIADAGKQLMDVGGQLAGAFLDAATQENEKALADAQARLQDATSKLSELQSSINSDENKLATAQGAAREYYLEKLAKERQQLTAIAAAKAKAAADEKKQTEEQHRLQKIGLELSAAATLASNVAAAAAAVAAGVKAVSSASAIPFPGNIAAIITAVATVGAAVASAKQLATAVKYEAGGLIFGPSHARGGVPFTVGGRPGFEAEGGEFIVRKSAVTAATLPVLHLINQAGRATVLPHPTGHYANGGRVSTVEVPSGAVAVPLADLSALLANTQGMLDHLASINGATAATAGYGPARLTIGPAEAQQIEQEKQKAEQAERFASL